MRIRGFRHALSSCVAAILLAGCGGSQPPLSSSAGGFAPQRSLVEDAYRVLYSFGGSSGVNPFAGLIDVKGTLYGTTAEGGTYDGGTVFAISGTGKEIVLHNFGASGDGKWPIGDLLDVNGTLYGTTVIGGTDNDGTVFEIAKSGEETVLHSFGGTSNGDGAQPSAGLLNVNGTLYGTTASGGSHGYGTVFSITKNGKEIVIHGFGNSGDGSIPEAPLLNVNGTLYGTTEFGGAYGYGSYGYGTVFEINKSGNEAVLHNFGRPHDGAVPSAGLINVSGVLYGTTWTGGTGCNSEGGCGVVFEITTSGTENVRYSFKGGPSDGDYPAAGLLNVNGTLYGTTLEGGASNNGTVFAIEKSGKERLIHSLKGGPKDGAGPHASLVDVNGTLYGTTKSGGADNDGTVFTLSP